MKKTLILGIDNPHSSDPSDALRAERPGSTGRRLQELTGMSVEGYYEAFDRANAVDLRVRRDAVLGGRTVVVLGKQAWRVLGLSEAPFFTERRSDVLDSTFVLIPHPSGLCRLYNEQAVRDRVASLLRRKSAVNRSKR